jgi:tRNA-2-methylthio-N6-dimethylallyladenosine synthase
VSGRTRQNKLVHFPAPDGATVRPGSFAQVRITSAAAHFLRGELVEVTERPRHRTRIPLAVG